MVHALNARGQRLAIGHQAHAVVADKRFSVLLWPEDIFAVGHVEGTIAVGHQRQPLDSLDLASQEQQLGRQMLAIGDHLGRQLVEIERCFQNAAAHRVGLFLAQSGPVRHGAEQMIDVAHAPAYRHLHLREGGVAVSGTRTHAALHARSHKRLRPRQLGCDRRSNDQPIGEILLILGRIGRANRAAGMASARFGAKVRTIKMHAEQLRMAGLRPVAMLPAGGQRRRDRLVRRRGRRR